MHVHARQGSPTVLDTRKAHPESPSYTATDACTRITVTLASESGTSTAHLHVCAARALLAAHSWARARPAGATRKQARDAGDGGMEDWRGNGLVTDLGLDGALDERPQPRHGEHEEPQRRVVARLRVPGPAGRRHRRRGVEQDRGVVERRARGGSAEPSPGPGHPPGEGGRAAPRRRRGAEREEEAPRGRGGGSGGVHSRSGDKAAGVGKQGAGALIKMAGPTCKWGMYYCLLATWEAGNRTRGRISYLE
jgi:hypothetical protein